MYGLLVHVLTGHDDLHFDAALRGLAQCFNQWVVGDEISVFDEQALLRGSDHEMIHQFDGELVLPGGAGKGAGFRRSDRS